MSTQPQQYTPAAIEPKWQKYWEEQQVFVAANNLNKFKWYTLIEFPYPSGAGLHVGHVRSYTALDVVARKKRMEGYNVLYPIGWDAFGLPTENYAIKNKIHPRLATEQNIATFKRQLHALGLSFDWSREINTTDPAYYKWTQWIFLKLFQKGLAYQANIPINWCSSCKIGLANEEVVDGKCERCGALVTKKKMKQWMLKITAYADRLLNDLETVDYPTRIKSQQINWIGRSEGLGIDFAVEGKKMALVTFTKYPETIYGVTFLVIAPEHPFVKELTTEEQRTRVLTYQEAAFARTDIERGALNKEKSGMFTGSYAINPVNNERIPIWVADFVLAHFGTGVVMGVPAHDKRDFQFAQKFQLPIKRVIQSDDGTSGPVNQLDDVIEEGMMINSHLINGLDAQTEAKEKIMSIVEERGWGKRQVTYSLRDWVFSRQHYWGEPIPIIHCSPCGAVSVPEDQLPICLPEVEHYEPTNSGASPLAAMTDWVNTTCPHCGGPAQRETDTMPNWAGSSWYFLRYTDPHNDRALASTEALQYWMPVDLYNGGFEHTTLHLLYSRFWHKFLFDIGVVPTPEPYARRRSHGIVLAHDGRKMSKSFGNVVNPDDIIAQYGADTLRLYELFMGPFEEAIAWDGHGVKGVRRFLDRVWRVMQNVEDVAPTPEQERVLHQTIKKVTDDVEAMKFNTAVAQFMSALNAMERWDSVPMSIIEGYLVVLSPFASHLAEELWHQRGHTTSITQETWPQADPAKVHEDCIRIAVQVNGKVRDTIEVVHDAVEKNVITQALASVNVARHTHGKEVKNIRYIPGKIVSIVTS